MKRILIIDDDLDFGMMTHLSLQATGLYRTRAISFASQTLRVAKDFSPDLILLDCMMPGHDGGEVAAQLEADPTLKDIPVLFLTATVSEKEVQSSSCYHGVRTYLPKTIGLGKLTEAIDAAIAERAQGRPA